MKIKQKQVQICLLCAVLLLLPAMVQAQFNYSVNAGGATITITGYYGPAGNVSIPSRINGMSVTSIGFEAFFLSFTNGLVNLTIPDSVTSIGANAFWLCGGLASLIVGKGVTNIGTGAFAECGYLTNIYFSGNAPVIDGYLFTLEFFPPQPIICYLPGTTGWGASFAGQPTALWLTSKPQIINCSIHNGSIGFTVYWQTNAVVEIDACTNLANPCWLALATNTLTDGELDFGDLLQTNIQCRYYRVRSL